MQVHGGLAQPLTWDVHTTILRPDTGDVVLTTGNENLVAFKIHWHIPFDYFQAALSSRRLLELDDQDCETDDELDPSQLCNDVYPRPEDIGYRLEATQGTAKSD